MIYFIVLASALLQPEAAGQRGLWEYREPAKQGQRAGVHWESTESCYTGSLWQCGEEGVAEYPREIAI